MASDYFPGRNSVVEKADGEKIQIQTQLHDDWTPKVIRTEVIIKGQVKIDKRTEVDDLLKEKGSKKKVNDRIWKQHQSIFMSIKRRVDAQAKTDEEEEQTIEETLHEVEEEVKEAGFFGKMLGGLFGKKK